MKNAETKLIFWSKNRTYVVEFDIKMGVFEDEKFNKHIFVDLSMIVSIFTCEMVLKKIEISILPRVPIYERFLNSFSAFSSFRNDEISNFSIKKD